MLIIYKKRKTKMLKLEMNHNWNNRQKNQLVYEMKQERD